MRTIRYSAQFKKDYKRCVKRGLPLAKLAEVLDYLVKGDALPPQYRDHQLIGTYYGHRECHIAPNWLLIYLIKDDELTVTAVRTGSHADLLE